MNSLPLAPNEEVPTPDKMLRFFIAISLLLGCAAANNSFSHVEDRQQQNRLAEFPSRIGDWTAFDEQKMDQRALSELLVDDYLMRSYENGEGKSLGLYIGYFAKQREGKQVHSPRQCLPGSGWEKISHEEHVLLINGREARVNVDIMRKGNSKEMYIWWYQGRGRIYASEYRNKIYLLWDAAFKRRTDGALVRVNSSIRSDTEDTRKALLGYMRLIEEHLWMYVSE